MENYNNYSYSDNNLSGYSSDEDHLAFERQIRVGDEEAVELVDPEEAKALTSFSVSKLNEKGTQAASKTNSTASQTLPLKDTVKETPTPVGDAHKVDPVQTSDVSELYSVSLTTLSDDYSSVIDSEGVDQGGVSVATQEPDNDELTEPQQSASIDKTKLTTASLSRLAQDKFSDLSTLPNVLKQWESGQYSPMLDEDTNVVVMLPKQKNSTKQELHAVKHMLHEIENSANRGETGIQKQAGGQVSLSQLLADIENHPKVSQLIQNNSTLQDEFNVAKEAINAELPKLEQGGVADAVVGGNARVARVLAQAGRCNKHTKDVVSQLADYAQTIQQQGLSPESEAILLDNMLEFGDQLLAEGMSIPANKEERAEFRQAMKQITRSARSSSRRLNQPNLSKKAKLLRAKLDEVAPSVRIPSERRIVKSLERAKTVLENPSSATAEQLQQAADAYDRSVRMELNSDTIENLQNEIKELITQDTLYSFRGTSAEQLYQDCNGIMESEFRNVNVAELDNGKFQTFHDAPSIHQTTRTQSQMSTFLEGQVLQSTTPEECSQAILKIIKLGNVAAKNHNYQLVTSCMGALGTNEIHRLTEAHYESWSEDQQDALWDLKDLTESSGAKMQVLSRKESEVRDSSGAPYLPYTGNYLSDVTFTLDGSPELDGGQVSLKRNATLAKTKSNLRTAVRRAKRQPIKPGAPLLQLSIRAAPSPTEGMSFADRRGLINKLSP